MGNDNWLLSQRIKINKHVDTSDNTLEYMQTYVNIQKHWLIRAFEKHKFQETYTNEHKLDISKERR